MGTLNFAGKYKPSLAITNHTQKKQFGDLPDIEKEILYYHSDNGLISTLQVVSILKVMCEELIPGVAFMVTVSTLQKRRNNITNNSMLN